MDGIVFSKLDEIVKNPDVLTKEYAPDHWYVMPYVAEDVSGNCLAAAEDEYPEDLILAPKINGWHKVFIGTWKLDGGYSFRMKLDNDKYFNFVNDSFYPSWGQWTYMETVEELFWRCADLTDREIIVKKPNRAGVAPLVWVRCVPMTEEEVAAYKAYINPEGHRNMHLHFDCDANYIWGIHSVEDSLMKLSSVENTDAKIVTQEVMESLYDYSTKYTTDRRLRTHSNKYSDENENAANLMPEISKARVDMLHDFGTLAYAGLRMSIGKNYVPVEQGFRVPFVDAHPEYYLCTRDGRAVATLSYAYPAVWDFVIDYLKKFIGYGYDGVSLFFHRGMHIAFEQPVLDEFARRYDGLDARLVPMDDARLKDVWCSFLTAFIRRLRDELDAFAGRHVPINIITGYTPEISRRIGIDVEELAKAGLIDHICGDCMETYERLGGCLDENGLIKMDVYTKALRKQAMVCRRFGESWELTKEGSLQYQAIADKYGIDYFAPLSPNIKTKAEDYINWVKDLKVLGVKNINFFNFCHSSQDVAVRHTTTKFGHDEVNLEYCRLNHYRIMSMDDCDISTYMPHWMG